MGTIQLSNIILKVEYDKFKKMPLDVMKDCLHQYELAEAGACVFMAVGAGNEWLESVEFKKKFLEKLIEVTEFVQNGN